MDKIDEFIEDLLNRKGITDIDPELREALKADMRTRLNDQINRAAIMELSEDKAAELSAHLDDPSFTNEDFGKFMTDSGVDLARVVANTMTLFEKFYLGSEE